MEVKFTSIDTFEEDIKSNDIILVDFFATWCGPCKMLAPILEEVNEEIEKNVSIFKLDIDKNMDIAKKFGVMSVPTLILFKKGEENNRIVGLRSKEQIIDEIKKI